MGDSYGYGYGDGDAPDSALVTLDILAFSVAGDVLVGDYRVLGGVASTSTDRSTTRRLLQINQTLGGSAIKPSHCAHLTVPFNDTALHKRFPKPD